MNSKKFLKLASIFDKQGNYKTSDLVYKERKVQDVTIDTLNETLDNALTELYYVYKG